MAQIRRLLAGAGPPVLLLAGEPGMGKTRLLEESAGQAAGSMWGIARGGCLRRAQDAYAPLSGALADVLARLPAGERARAVRQAGRVDLLLPEFAPPGGPARARQRFAASSPPMAVRAVRILASALTWHGDWDQARDYLDGCLRSARSLRIVHSERSALAYLAELDTLHGRPRDALARLHPVTADHSPPATEDLTWNYAVLLLSVLATAHLELGDLPPARAYARRAVSQARTTGAWMQGIRALEVHGMIQARDGHYDLARATYQEGLNRAAAMPFPYGQARLLHAHGLLDRQQHDHAAAHAKLAQALAIFDNLGAGKDVARLRQAIADTPRSG